MKRMNLQNLLVVSEAGGSRKTITLVPLIMNPSYNIPSLRSSLKDAHLHLLQNNNNNNNSTLDISITRSMKLQSIVVINIVYFLLLVILLVVVVHNR